MKMQGKLIDSFGVAARPLMKWIRENGHPHITVIVTNGLAEVVEGLGMTIWEEVANEEPPTQQEKPEGEIK